jgi:hypothetical protein
MSKPPLPPTALEFRYALKRNVKPQPPQLDAKQFVHKLKQLQLEYAEAKSEGCTESFGEFCRAKTRKARFWRLDTIGLLKTAEEYKSSLINIQDKREFERYYNSRVKRFESDPKYRDMLHTLQQAKIARQRALQ